MLLNLQPFVIFLEQVFEVVLRILSFGQPFFKSVSYGMYCFQHAFRIQVLSFFGKFLSPLYLGVTAINTNETPHLFTKCLVTVHNLSPFVLYTEQKVYLIHSISASES